MVKMKKVEWSGFIDGSEGAQLMWMQMLLVAVNLVAESSEMCCYIKVAAEAEASQQDATWHCNTLRDEGGGMTYLHLNLIGSAGCK